MGTRGQWNINIYGTWYRLCLPAARISPPTAEYTFEMIKRLLDHGDDLEGWNVIPFPSPLHSSLSYIYTHHKDEGVFIVSEWNSALVPEARRIDLATLCESSDLVSQYSQSLPESRFKEAPGEVGESYSEVSGTLEIPFGMPTSMNELQERFFTDFVFMWRFYMDDPLTWYYDSAVFKVITIAFLRLAAWDFEVSLRGDADLPVSFTSIPSWDFPTEDVYWFHGFLVILHDSIDSGEGMTRAIRKAKPYVDGGKREDQPVRLILISPRYVVFAELFQDNIFCTRSLQLLSNTSGLQCSPGFRALTRVFTSDCWKKRQTDKERWQLQLPTEILQMIFREMKPQVREMQPQGAIAFCKASMVAEQCYYTILPQFKDMDCACEFLSSVPCCGKLGGLKEDGICCSGCYAWYHLTCMGIENLPGDQQYVCVNCRENLDYRVHEPGGINKLSKRVRRDAYGVQVRGSVKGLQLRISKPSHLRPELRMQRHLPSSVRPNLIDYAILFNRSFSGLAYGLEDK